MQPPQAPTVDWLGLYLLEDIGPGDVTSDTVLAGGDSAQGPAGKARIVAREACVVAGLEHAVELFARLGATARPQVGEGAQVAAGATLLILEGPARAILAGERVALNLLARMAGIASATRELADRLAGAGSAARVAGTRKTTPGFRAFEKQAIAAGAGEPHRMGLWDIAMVKDNHRDALGGGPDGVRRAVTALREAHPRLEVVAEAETLEEAEVAAGAGAHWVLIDNQGPEAGRRWAHRLRTQWPALKVEASGGITPQSLVSYGWADRISLGWLTQKAPAKDLSLEWEPGPRQAWEGTGE